MTEQDEARAPFDEMEGRLGSRQALKLGRSRGLKHEPRTDRRRSVLNRTPMTAKSCVRLRCSLIVTSGLCMDD